MAKSERIRCAECEYFRHGNATDIAYDHCVNDVWFRENKSEWFHIVDRNFGSCKYGVKEERN